VIIHLAKEQKINEIGKRKVLTQNTLSPSFNTYKS
jgi:hypothetical protein